MESENEIKLKRNQKTSTLVKPEEINGRTSKEISVPVS